MAKQLCHTVVISLHVFRTFLQAQFFKYTHTSMLAYMGEDTTRISQRLGHSALHHLNIYTHLFEDTDEQITEDFSKQYLSK